MLDAKKGADPAHVEHVTSSEKYGLSITTSRARQGATAEHALTTIEAVKAYPMAIFWTLMVSLTIIMEGYDTIL